MKAQMYRFQSFDQVLQIIRMAYSKYFNTKQQ